MAEGTQVSAAATESSYDPADFGKLYPYARAVLSPIFKALWRIDVQGLDNLPATGGAVFCPNHTSVVDSYFLPLVLPRPIMFVGKAEYMDDWKTRRLFPGLGMIPIDRAGGSAAERALNTAARVLEAGKFFGIYPEGTRARDGRLHRGHTGPARLALRTGTPIIPVGIVGTREVQPPDAKLPKPFKRVSVRFGRPIDVARYQDRADDRMVLRSIIDEVMFEIRELSGQEYVDEYATKKAEHFPSAAPAHVASLGEAPANGNGHTDGERRSSADVLNRTA
jgi:1-acyl-sn-glycerol-3-phosphate acyltransferase